MDTRIEYRVRPVTRWIVTKFEGLESEAGQIAGSSSTCGEFDNFEQAYQVGYALAKADHNRLGYPPDDERIGYPDPIQATAPAQHYADLLNACSVASKGWLNSEDVSRLASGDWGIALEDVVELRERFNALVEMTPGYWDLPEAQQRKPTALGPDDGP